MMIRLSILSTVVLSLSLSSQQQVTPLGQPPAEETRKLVVYDIKDLTAAIDQETLVELWHLGLGAGAGGALGLPGEAQQADSPVDPEQLARRSAEAAASAESLRQVIEHALQPLRKDDTLQLIEDKALVANLTQAQHDWVRRFLETQRSFDSLLQIDAKFVTGPVGSLAKRGYAETTQTFETKELLASFWRRVLVSEGSDAEGSDLELISVPTIVAFAGRRTSMVALESLSYVADWELHTVQPGDQVIADPRIEVVQDGILSELRVTPLGDGVFSVEFSIEKSDVTEPMATIDTTLGGTSKRVTIALPEVQLFRVRGRMTVRDGTGALFVGANADAGQEVGLLLQVKQVDRLPEDALEQGLPGLQLPGERKKGAH